MAAAWLALLSTAICSLMFEKDDDCELEPERATLAEVVLPLAAPSSIPTAVVRDRASFNKLTISTMAPVVATAATPLDSKRKSAPSPCSVDAHPLSKSVPASASGSTSTEQTEHLPLVGLSIAYMYDQMVKNGHWSTEFHRGLRPPRPPLKGMRPRNRSPKMGLTRTLATHHLSEPCTDGWNVIIGALELARKWGLDGAAEQLADVELGEYELPRWVRMRLACCLNVSFKFQRAQYSLYPHRFHVNDDPSLESSHTEELAHVAFSFFTLEEQSRFGKWSEENQKAVRALYAEMLALESNLVCTVSTFPLLAENVINCAEICLERVFDRGLRGDEAVMTMRSLMPFLLYSTMGGTYESLTKLRKETSAGSLLCATWVLVSTPASGQSLFRHSDAEFKVLFSVLERMWAVRILTCAARPRKIAGQLMTLGAYGEPTFRLRPFLNCENVCAALATAIASA